MDENKSCGAPPIWGGLECTINRVGDSYFDQLTYSDYYQHPQVEAIADVGIKRLRFPVLWERHQPSKETSIDWSWTEQQLTAFQSHGIEVIAGLLHHGSGPSFTNLLDPAFPELLAAYAAAVARQFPWLRYYTPVNEPLTTARFSALYGFWYPHTSDDKSFVRAVLNQVKGIILSMKAIRQVNPNACLVQTEDLAKIYSTPQMAYQAAFENDRRWLTYDLLTGALDHTHPLWEYLVNNGASEKELLFFKDQPCTPDIFGFNYYVTSERFLDERTERYPPAMHGNNGQHEYADVEACRADVGEETGLSVLLQEAWERYKQPIAITEVHLHCHREEQLRWFLEVYRQCEAAAAKGIPIVGVTAWALLGSYGWDRLLTAPGGSYEPGVYDLRGSSLQPTAYTRFLKSLCDGHTDVHPLSEVPGWWKRPTRYFFEPLIPAYMDWQEPHQALAPVLIIGQRGTLGNAFANICRHRAIPFRLLSREACDLNQPESIQDAIRLHKPWAIINAAGFVRVDDAERETEACFRDNYYAAENLALACALTGVKLVSFSSDLVFDGQKGAPYLESDRVAPLNVYGQSKAKAEAVIQALLPGSLVIRASAFFGPWDQYNFIHWVTDRLQNGQALQVANDVYISPTYVPDLVHTVLDLLLDDAVGIWHLANKGSITWADLAYETARRLGLDNRFIEALPLQAIRYPAPRPQYSVLGTEKGQLLPTLATALDRYFTEIVAHQALSTQV